jgi:hypothetical protein
VLRETNPPAPASGSERPFARGPLVAPPAVPNTPRTAILRPRSRRVIVDCVIVYAVIDDALSPDFPLGVELEVFVRRIVAEHLDEALASRR